MSDGDFIRPVLKPDNVGFARQFFARLGTDAAANPCGSQEGSDDALRKIDRRGGIVRFQNRSIRPVAIHMANKKVR